MRGGWRPGAGRPVGSKTKKSLKQQVDAAARRLEMTPLDYMLAVMSDPAVDAARRDRMAVAAAPYLHAKPD